MRKCLHFVIFLCASFSFNMLSGQAIGDLSFVDMNADGNDDYTLLAMEDIPANSIFYLRDDEWDGVGAFNTGEGIITWNSGLAVISKGTIIQFNNASDPATITVSIGTVSGTGNLGLSGGDEAMFVFRGTDGNTPTTFICAFGKGPENLSFGSLANTGLSTSNTAISFATPVDIVKYSGVRSGLTKTGFQALLANTSNYITEDGSGDQSANSIEPDLPFATTSFSFAATDVAAPAVAGVLVNASTTLKVNFTEPVSIASATNFANYVFIPALTISNIMLSVDGTEATITTSALVEGKNYQATINGIADIAGNIQTVASVTNHLYFNNYTGSDLVMTELMYNVGSQGDTLEFVELYNKGAAPIEIGGLKIADGIDGRFTEMTLSPGGFALIALDSAKAKKFYNQSFMQWTSGALSNGGELITIRNFSNTILDELTYSDAAPWPTQADGTGPSLEIVNALNDNNVASNWRFSFTGTGKNYGTVPYPVFASPGSLPILNIPNLTFKPVVQWIQESKDSASVTVELTGTNAAGVSFRIQPNNLGTATWGSDLEFFSKDTSFAPGTIGTITFKIKVNNDASIESDEYAVLEFANVTGANIINGMYHTIHLLDDDAKAPTANNALSLSLLSSYRNGASGTNSAEIVAYDKNTQRMWVVNSIAGKINIVNFSNPSAPVLHSTIDILPLGGINSIAIKNGVIAAAIENSNKLLPGKVVFFDADGNVLKQIDAGVLPDMVGISPDGKYVVTADEGEPATDYLTDPEGSVTIIDISGGIAGLTQANATVVSLASLNPFKGILRANGVRIFGRYGGVNDGSSVAQDLEPEYVTFSPDSKKAYVTVQEANALLVIDLDTKSIATLNGGPFLKSFGLKDHSLPGSGIDASDRADSINIAKWRVKGMHMPDAITTLQTAQGTFYITANEGDAREYTALTEETTLANLKLNPANFPDSVLLRQQAHLGRLSFTNQTGDTDGDGLFDELHVLGARSFTIWDANGNKVWDSGEDLERIVEENTRAFFNANNSTGNPAIKNRSDNKGPEPEGITVATVCGRSYVFVTLERSGGVVVYDVSNPTAPVFVTYANNRTAPANAATNDVGPEGILFIPDTESPNGKNLLLLANEISSSVSVFEVGCSPALPISITQFNGQLLSNDAVLQWQVADERDVQHFEIQHSNNGRQFVTVGKEKVLGTNYQFVHKGLSAGNHYYRLAATDRDGSSKFSKTILLQIGNGGTVITGLMQNPVRASVTPVIVTSKAQSATAVITDAAGRTMSSNRTILQPGQSLWNINTSTLQAGMYFVSIRTEDGTTSTLRFVKQ